MCSLTNTLCSVSRRITSSSASRDTGSFLMDAAELFILVITRDIGFIFGLNVQYSSDMSVVSRSRLAS